MGLYKKLDWWSLMDQIDEILEESGNRCFRNSENAGCYDELLSELADVAGGFWNDCEALKYQIGYRGIPYRSRRYAETDEETETAAFWFNAAVLTLTDVSTLFDREEKFGDTDKKKEKRLNMLAKLPKKDFIWLIQETDSLVIRYIDLCSAWEAVKGIIDELDSGQAFIKDKNGLHEPKSAYL